jgi:cytochrome P450
VQVSLAWVLVHLYDDPELLRRARDEIASCPDLNDYTQLEQLPFLNSCIDEAVRLHTMLPGNTVLRKTKRDVTLGSHTVEAGSVLWLYPNAVHLDEKVFPQPTAFCPMRLLNGNLERMTADFELVTFGHGQKRCIGEKMARAMIISFLGNALPVIDAAAPDDLPKARRARAPTRTPSPPAVPRQRYPVSGGPSAAACLTCPISGAASARRLRSF